jgi:hypothetical protein
MGTKLTLTLEKDVIVQAKRYAREKGLSLSEMVENYFVLLTQSSKTGDIGLSPTVKALKGSFNLPDDVDYKTILREEIAKKHL